MNLKTFFFPLTKLRSPYSNLAIEEAISLQLVKSGLIGGIRIWQNPPTIVLGLSENPELTINAKIIAEFKAQIVEKTLTKQPIPDLTYIARRASGGGTVFQNPTGNVNYSIYVNLEERKELFSVRDSYTILLGIVAEALGSQLIGATINGKSDLAIAEAGILKKISGNAQFRKRNCIVQHGTLILNQDLIKTVSGYLLHPPEEPEYRKARTHTQFLTALPLGFSVSKFESDLFSIFTQYLNIDTGEKKPDFSFFSKGFSSFRRSVLKESEFIRRRKYENLSYILNREFPS